MAKSKNPRANQAALLKLEGDTQESSTAAGQMPGTMCVFSVAFIQIPNQQNCWSFSVLSQLPQVRCI